MSHFEYTDWEKDYQIARHGVGYVDSVDIAQFHIFGKDSERFLNALCGVDVSYMNEGKICNTVLCKEDGTIVSTIWLIRDEECFYIHAESEQRALISKWLNNHSGNFSNVTIEDISDTLSCISILGPQSLEILKTVFDDDIIGLAYLGFEENEVESTQCVVYRYGYTGEYEYKLFFDKNKFESVSEKIKDIGQDFDLKLCNPDIYSILELEMKSTSHKTGLLKGISPLEAGLHWMLNFRKDHFIGKKALEKKKTEPYKKLLMIISSEKELVLEENAALFLDTTKIGEVATYFYSPTLDKSVALAYLDSPSAYACLKLNIQSNGKTIECKTVSSPTFISESVQISRGG